MSFTSGLVRHLLQPTAGSGSSLYWMLAKKIECWKLVVFIKDDNQAQWLSPQLDRLSFCLHVIFCSNFMYMLFDTKKKSIIQNILLNFENWIFFFFALEKFVIFTRLWWEAVCRVQYLQKKLAEPLNSVINCIQQIHMINRHKQMACFFITLENEKKQTCKMGGIGAPGSPRK